MELWHSLKIGDRVRIVAWPRELHEDRMHADTLELYKWLIDTGNVLEIVKLDELGAGPWGKIIRMVDGVEHFESLLLNHGGLELVSK
jgi:hypothetical protein